MPNTDFIFFSNNKTKARSLVAGFCPDRHALRRCFEFAASGDLAVGLFFIFECFFF